MEKDVGGEPVQAAVSPSYSQALSTSNLSVSEDPVRTGYSLPPGLDEVPESGNFAAAPDAPTAPVPEGNPRQIYIGEHFLQRERSLC